MLTLTASQQEYLLRQPESGMGYQFVGVTMADNREMTAIAYNAELVLTPDEPKLRAFFESFAFGVGITTDAKPKRIRVIARNELRNRLFSVGEARAPYSSRAEEAKDARPTSTNAGDVFKRFSAFANDRRIRSDGSLYPGTYATTAADALNINTGKDAVARYALPNPAPAVNVFTISPLAATAIQSGTVAPANGQPGGGVEVIFVAGTTAATVTGPATIAP